MQNNKVSHLSFFFCCHQYDTEAFLLFPLFCSFSFSEYISEYLNMQLSRYDNCERFLSSFPFSSLLSLFFYIALPSALLSQPLMPLQCFCLSSISIFCSAISCLFLFVQTVFSFISSLSHFLEVFVLSSADHFMQSVSYLCQKKRFTFSIFVICSH